MEGMLVKNEERCETDSEEDKQEYNFDDEVLDIKSIPKSKIDMKELYKFERVLTQKERDIMDIGWYYELPDINDNDKYMRMII